ncbi:hypothetical protein OIU84_017598 [Salix udensis]|uniref:KIB1-4 beta-propeller domain-containing protein n=1 Tax=Salix udensis TaxID=889485 RepID=A0AAD6L280_9ROSI|nr:hypothetical protein OIU84_017598 [Salix udensis]
MQLHKRVVLQERKRREATLPNVGRTCFFLFSRDGVSWACSMEANTKEEGEEGESLQCWPPTVGLHPWLVFINGSSEENQTFYDTQKVIAMSKAFQSCKKIQLPSLTPDFSYDNCVLSSPPDNPECVVMFLNFDIGTFDVTFCKPDNVEWIRQDFKFHDEDDSDYVRLVGVHKGDICILTWYEHLYFVKFDKSYSITLVDLKVDDNTCPTMRKLHSRFPTYLVETCGELLRLHCYILH